jgi:hypothetical protein
MTLKTAEKDRLFMKVLAQVKSNLGSLSHETEMLGGQMRNKSIETETKVNNISVNVNNIMFTVEKHEEALRNPIWKESLQEKLANIQKLNDSLMQTNHVLNSYKEELKHLVKSDSKMSQEMMKVDSTIKWMMNG